MKDTVLISRHYIPMYLKERSNRVWLLAFCSFNLMDFVLTQMAVRSGDFIEMNPVWGQGVIGPLASGYKLLVGPLIAILWASPLHPVISRYWIRFLALVFLIVCILNIHAVVEG